MVERLSINDQTFFSSYSDHILRYQFAAEFCSRLHVLDAGCGIGYGSAYLAKNAAASVLGVDISDVALDEARNLFPLPNLSFKKQNVEALQELSQTFDVIVNFENIEHIPHPDKLVSGAAQLAKTFITSTPNGALTQLTVDGRPSNPFHIKEFTVEELNAMLRPHFTSVELYGQWLTPSGRLRKIRAKELFDDLNELYYSPTARIGRAIKSALGKSSKPPPAYAGEADSFVGDYAIHPLEDNTFPWQPTVILALCRNS